MVRSLFQKVLDIEPEVGRVYGLIGLITGVMGLVGLKIKKNNLKK